MQPEHRQAGEQGRVSFLIKNVHLKKTLPCLLWQGFSVQMDTPLMTLQCAACTEENYCNGITSCRKETKGA